MKNNELINILKQVIQINHKYEEIEKLKGENFNIFSLTPRHHTFELWQMSVQAS